MVLYMQWYQAEAPAERCVSVYARVAMGVRGKWFA